MSTAVAQMPWEPDVVVILEEESICGGAQRSVGPWSFRPRGFVMPDDPDLDALLAAAEAYDAELGAAFRAQHERTKTGIPAKPYSAQDLEDVIRQAAAKVRAEVPTAATASVSRTGGVVRVTASSEPVLDRRVTVGAASCPTVRQFPEGTLRDDLRCAFEGIPGMAIPMSPILTGGNWILTPSTAPAEWRDQPLRVVLEEFYRSHDHGEHGFLVLVEDHVPEVEAPPHLQMRHIPTVYPLD